MNSQTAPSEDARFANYRHSRIVFGTLDEIRTHTEWLLRPLPLPIGLRGHCLGQIVGVEPTPSLQQLDPSIRHFLVVTVGIEPTPVPLMRRTHRPSMLSHHSLVSSPQSKLGSTVGCSPTVVHHTLLLDVVGTPRGNQTHTYQIKSLLCKFLTPAVHKKWPAPCP